MDQFAARRKLLKGTLSAPLVLTVTSVGATSVTTFNGCLDRAEGSSTTAVRDICDQWYRISRSLRKDSSGNLYIRAYSSYGYFNDYGYCHKIAPAVGDSYSLLDTVQMNWSQLQDTGKKVAALCYFDQYNNCKGYAWTCNSPGTKVSKSCYASVNGGTKI